MTLELETALKVADDLPCAVFSYDARWAALSVLAAEFRAQVERTCNRCQDEKGESCERLTKLARGKYAIYCKDVGYTCGRWKLRKTSA